MFVIIHTKSFFIIDNPVYFVNLRLQGDGGYSGDGSVVKSIATLQQNRPRCNPL